MGTEETSALSHRGQAEGLRASTFAEVLAYLLAPCACAWGMGALLIQPPPRNAFPSCSLIPTWPLT